MKKIHSLVIFFIFVLFFILLNVNPAFAGTIEAWGGRNHFGEINAPEGNDFIDIAARGYYSLALRFDGSLIGWGDNYYGQTNVPGGNDFIDIAAGATNGLALRSDGSLIGWGDNYYGQTNVPGGNDFIDISSGFGHSLALRSDGSLVGWGTNIYGQNNVPGGNDFVGITSAFSHSLALRSDGSLVSWGRNDFGQTNVPEGNDFVAIAGGNKHSLALKEDGSLVGWGHNIWGQTNVPEGNDFVAIAEGSFNSLALKEDGSLVGWGGQNESAQISFYTPEGYDATNVPEGNDFVAISSGIYHHLALVDNGVEKTPLPDGQTLIEPPDQTPPSNVGLWSMNYVDDDTAYFEKGTHNVDPTKPTVVLTHGWVPSNRNDDGTMDAEQLRLPEWVRDSVNVLTDTDQKNDTTISKLLGKRDDINVLAWNWTEVASTTYGGLFDPLNVEPKPVDPMTGLKWPGKDFTDQGVKLAKELENVLGTNYDEKIHFLGHSLGGGISTMAGVELKKMGLDVDQVSIFDTPERNGLFPDNYAAMYLQYTLLPNASDLGIWVDNYPTLFGKDYSETSDFENVVNFNIKGEINIADIGNHGYPMTWYIGANQENINEYGTIDLNRGNPNMDVGSAWSHVINDRPSSNDWLASNEINSARINMNEVQSFTVPPALNFEYTLIPSDTQSWYYHDETHSIMEDLGGIDYWFKQGDVYFDDGTYHMTTASPVYLFRELLFPDVSQFLTFNFYLDDPLADDYLALYIGDDQLFNFWGDSFPTDWDDFLTSGAIDVTSYAGTTQSLTFMYNSSEIGHMARISDIALYRYESDDTLSNVVPEPATIFLLGGGLFGLLGFRRKRKS